MNKNDLIDMVRKIKNCKGTEEELDIMLNDLENNVVCPNISDLIFFDEKTPEEIVEQILAYKPIILYDKQNNKLE